MAVQVKLWGVRGSIPVPGGATAGFGGNTACVQVGGNTACVQVTTGDGGVVILDAGHSCVSDALLYARRCEAQHLVLFHHDPWHDDAMLESMWQDAEARWGRLGGEGPIEMARQGQVITLGT